MTAAINVITRQDALDLCQRSLLSADLKRNIGAIYVCSNILKSLIF